MSYPRAVPSLIFLAITAITSLGVVAIESNVRTTTEVQTGKVANAIASQLSHQASIATSSMRAAAVVFSNEDNIPLSALRQFRARVEPDFEVAGAGDIGWMPRDAGPEAALSSEPSFAAALEEAMASGRPAVSGRTMIAPRDGDGGDTSGFYILMSVFQNEGGDRELRGVLYRSFDAARFLDGAISVAPDASRVVRLYDGEAGPSRLLAEHAVTGSEGKALRKPVRVSGRSMLLEVQAPKAALLSSLSIVSLVLGLAVAGLLAALARMLTRQVEEDQARLQFFEEHYSIRNSLTRELNHRVKNTLANVLSLLSLTRRRATNIDDFAEGLAGRIRALSATHDLLTTSEWGTTPIASVVRAELAHISEAREHEIAISGPDVELAPNDALTFGQAIHELATNAAKFGALSAEAGKLSITWDLIEPHLAEVQWRETGGPKVCEPRGRGFGTELIQKIVSHELKQPVELDFDAEGVRCVLRVPVRQTNDFQMREQTAD